MPVIRPGAGRLVVVQAVGGQLADLEERRAGIEQALDPVAGQQLAAGDVALAARPPARPARPWPARSRSSLDQGAVDLGVGGEGLGRRSRRRCEVSSCGRSRVGQGSGRLFQHKVKFRNHRLAHGELLHLAGDGGGKAFHETDVAWNLVVGDLAAAEVAHRLGASGSRRASARSRRRAPRRTSASGTPITCTSAIAGWR